jgi:hypothetical protein
MLKRISMGIHKNKFLNNYVLTGTVTYDIYIATHGQAQVWKGESEDSDGFYR